MIPKNHSSSRRYGNTREPFYFFLAVAVVVRGCEENAPTSKFLEGDSISYEMCRSMQHSGKHITIKLYQLIANSDVSSSGALHRVEKGCSFGVVPLWRHHPFISVLMSLMIWLLETFRKTEWRSTAHCFFVWFTSTILTVLSTPKKNRSFLCPRKTYRDAIEHDYIFMAIWCHQQRSEQEA